MSPSLLLLAALSLAADGQPPPPPPPATAAKPKPRDWKEEFADICAKTQEASGLTDDDLKALVKRSDDLKPTIDKLPETERKVYGRRLDACRKLFAYVLESRQKP
jgi:hypothetical protein